MKNAGKVTAKRVGSEAAPEYVARVKNAPVEDLPPARLAPRRGRS